MFEYDLSDNTVHINFMIQCGNSAKHSVGQTNTVSLIEIDQCEDTGKGVRIFCFSDGGIECRCSIAFIEANVLKQSDKTSVYLIVTFYTNFSSKRLNFMYNQIK